MSHRRNNETLNSGSVAPALAITALVALIAGCRPEVLKSIDRTVDSLDSLCDLPLAMHDAKVTTSGNTDTISIDPNVFVGPNGASCDCTKMGDGTMDCSYLEPDDKNVDFYSRRPRRSIKVQAKIGSHVETKLSIRGNGDDAPYHKRNLISLDGSDSCTDFETREEDNRIDGAECERSVKLVVARLTQLHSAIKARGANSGKK